MGYGYNRNRKTPAQMAYAAVLARMKKNPRTGKPMKAVKKYPATQAKGKGKYPTKTRSLFQKASPNVPGMAGAGTFTTVKTKHMMSSWQKGLKKNGALSTVQYNSSGSLSCISGAQQYGNLVTLYPASEISSQIETILPAGTNPRTQKALLETAQAVTYFTNQTNAPLSLDIYDVVARRDMPRTSDSFANDPCSLWLQGMNQAGAGSSAPSNVGVNPFQSPLFCQAWKIIKVSKVQLPQVQTLMRYHYMIEYFRAMQ